MSSRPSPLPNRVAPDGTILTTPARGTMMGNRGGKIHEGWAIRRRWASRRWICCVTDFRGRSRRVMESGYTELFFLDEATALAAGHRPCFECRRADATAFAGIWAAEIGPARADDMDRVLHRERQEAPDRCPAHDLPIGAIFRDRGLFWLVFGVEALIWSDAGYIGVAPTPDHEVAAITPPSIRRVLAAGYRAGLHASWREALV